MTPRDPGHPALAGLDLAAAPPILGYNTTRPKAGSSILATWEGTEHPALAVAEIGAGKVAAYTSDPAPHWGCNLVYWPAYNRLWSNVLEWLISR